MCQTPSGRSHPHSATGVSAFPDLLFPLVFQECRCIASQKPAGGGVRVDYGQVQHEIPPPVPGPEQDICRASAIPGKVHFAVMRHSGLGKDLAEERLSAKLPVPKAQRFARHSVVAENISRPSTHGGHGLPAQSAGSRGTARCHFSSVE